MKRIFLLILVTLSTLSFSQLWAQCDIIDGDTLIICDPAAPGTLIDVCVPMLPGTAFMNSLTVNGSPYGALISGCGVDTITAYDMSLLGADITCSDLLLWQAWTGPQGTLLPFALTGGFAQLADSLNAYSNPGANWSWDGSQFVSTDDHGGFSPLIYPNLDLRCVSTLMDYNIALNQVIVSRSTELSLAAGACHWVAIDSAGCLDSIYICISDCPMITTDTVFANVPLNTITNLCLVPGEVDVIVATMTRCSGSPTTPNGMTSNMNPVTMCFDYTPNVGYTGMDSFCVVFCDAANNCDTTFFIISIPGICDIFAEDTANICGTRYLGTGPDGAYCLPIAPLDYNLYDIYVGGSVLGPLMAGCDSDTTSAYDLSLSQPGDLTCGNYVLNKPWNSPTGAVLMPFAFTSFSQLADSLAAYDPAGAWTWDGVQFLLTMDHQTNYDTLQYRSLCSLTDYQWLINRTLLAQGSEIPVPPNACTWVVVDDRMGCLDSILVCHENSCGAISDTIVVTVAANDTSVICIPGANISLANPPVNISTCSGSNATAFGTILGFLPPDCFTYLPNTNVVGDSVDNTCIIIDDGMGNVDTTYVIINIVPPPDTMMVSVLPGDTTLICIPGALIDINSSTLTTCDGTNLTANGTIVSIIPPDCFTYVSNGTFTGADTACFVHTDPFGNTDTTIVIIDVISNCVNFMGPTVNTFLPGGDACPGDMVIYTANGGGNGGAVSYQYYSDSALTMLLSTGAIYNHTVDSMLSPIYVVATDGICTSPAGILIPVCSVSSDLGELFSNVNKCEVTLSWKSYTEVSVTEYIVQESKNGVDYVNISNVIANGLQGIGANYNTTVSGSNTLQYYRVVQVLENGAKNVTNTVVAKTSCSSITSVNGMYPNPATNAVNLDIVNPTNESLTINVVDFTGKTVISKTVENSGNVSIGLDELSSAFYFITVYSNEGLIYNQKLLKSAR